MAGSSADPGVAGPLAHGVGAEADAAAQLPTEPLKRLTKAGHERKRDPERTSAAILAAAVQEFSQKGYEGARIDAIARRAKINKRMLYHYFGGKDGLYLAVLEGRYAAIRSAEQLLDLTHREPVEGMRNLIAFTWNYFLEHPEFLAILATENLHKARFLKQSERIVQLNSPLIDPMRQVLARGAEAKIFKPGVDPVQLYISIAGLGAFYLSNRWTLSTIFRRDLLSDEEIAAWGDHIVDMVLAFLRP
ncbi:MAG: TetR/AcrR family transcriptional regulator [Devosia sp.]|nr:TetR/AcrR family transcriptional regulator [Devosia sp.]